MIAETYQFICKHCDKGYRGLVKTCPNCGKQIRPEPSTQKKMTLEQALVFEEISFTKLKNKYDDAAEAEKKFNDEMFSIWD